MTDELVKRLRANTSWGDDRFSEAAARIEQLVATNEQLTAERDRLREALWAILACETPNANATVTRMVAIARAALKGETP